MLDPVTAYVLAVVFIATLIRSTLGFGEALVAVPLLALRLPISIAAPLAVLVSVAMAGIIVLQDWRHVQLRSATGLILAALPGIPVGILLLAKGDEHMVKLILGLFIIGFSIYSLAAKTTPHLRRDHPRWLFGCGFLSGVLGGVWNERPSPRRVRRAPTMGSPAFSRNSAGLFPGGKPGRPWRLLGPWDLERYGHEIFPSVAASRSYCHLDRTFDEPANEG